MITDHADVASDDSISGMATPLCGRFKNTIQTAAENKPASIENAPTLFPEDCLTKATPMISIDNVLNMKKDTET